MYRKSELYPVENDVNCSCTDCDDEPEYSITEQSMLFVYDVELVNEMAPNVAAVTVVGPGQADDM